LLRKQNYTPSLGNLIQNSRIRTSEIASLQDIPKYAVKFPILAVSQTETLSHSGIKAPKL
jgi:hypothetical protein